MRQFALCISALYELSANVMYHRNKLMTKLILKMYRGTREIISTRGAGRPRQVRGPERSVHLAYTSQMVNGKAAYARSCGQCQKIHPVMKI